MDVEGAREGGTSWESSLETYTLSYVSVLSRSVVSNSFQPMDADRLSDFPNIAREKLDMLVSEGAHFSSGALMNELSCCEAEKIAIVHVFPQAKYDEFENEKHRLKGELILPNDGDEFII